jgi:hypothetical protein
LHGAGPRVVGRGLRNVEEDCGERVRATGALAIGAVAQVADLPVCALRA